MANSGYFTELIKIRSSTFGNGKMAVTANVFANTLMNGL